MPELTLGQTLDDLVFRMGRVENFIVKLVRLQQLRLNDSKDLQTEVIEIGNAILNSRMLKSATGLHTFLEKNITEKTKIYPRISALPVECSACHMRFKNKMALRAHITNDANWGRRKFRALHKEARTKQVWR